MAHTCHWPGCPREVPPAMWGCSSHWRKLPEELRKAIWRAYVPGQEVTKTPSKKYIEVARIVQAWIAGNVTITKSGCVLVQYKDDPLEPDWLK